MLDPTPKPYRAVIIVAPSPRLEHTKKAKETPFFVNRKNWPDFFVFAPFRGRLLYRLAEQGGGIWPHDAWADVARSMSTDGRIVSPRGVVAVIGGTDTMQDRPGHVAAHHGLRRD